MPSGTAIVDFGIATNRKWKAQDGSEREEVCFVNVRAFANTAETINKYLTKGSPIFIEGRLTYDNWTAQDGSKRSAIRVILERFQFIGGNGQGGQGGGQAQSQSSGYAGSAHNPPAVQGQPSHGDVPRGTGGIPEDEIPF